MQLDDVCAVLVTRGNVNLAPILDSLPYTETVVWDNSTRPDLKSSGLYEAIKETRRPFIYFQDDDCIVSPDDHRRLLEVDRPDAIAALMPTHRTDYHDSVLCGWGSIWQRDLPAKAFDRYERFFPINITPEWLEIGADFVWPILTPHVRLDADHQDLPYAAGPGRTSTTPGYEETKATFLAQARMARDRSLTVIVPTVGRPSLARTLAGIDIDCEVIVVADTGGDVQAAERMAAGCVFATADPKPGRGNGPRRKGMQLATGTHLVFIDDDDVHVPGGLRLMAQAATDRPVIFRMDSPNDGIVWNSRTVGFGNVGTPMFIVPNVPNLGIWRPFNSDVGSDYVFIKDCCDNLGGPVWREEIVAQVRP